MKIMYVVIKSFYSSILCYTIHSTIKFRGMIAFYDNSANHYINTWMNIKGFDQIC
jgi:hypothetical protein